MAVVLFCLSVQLAQAAAQSNTKPHDAGGWGQEGQSLSALTSCRMLEGHAGALRKAPHMTHCL